jgi:hypothetical protein
VVLAISAGTSQPGKISTAGVVLTVIGLGVAVYLVLMH